MSEEWDFYIRETDGAPESIVLDLWAGADGPDASLPVRLAVTVALRLPRPDGLSRGEESAELGDVEDRLVEVARQRGASYVARVTSNGHRSHCFYTRDAAGFEDAAVRALRGTAYVPRIEVADDPAWRMYFDLYPDPIQFRQIIDRRVLEALRSHGDDLSQERGIHHWVYFQDRRGRDDFAVAARAAGFTAIPFDSNATKKRRELGVQLHRVDPVAPPRIHEVVTELVELAAQFSGEYDGWETQVVKFGETPTDDTPSPRPEEL